MRTLLYSLLLVVSCLSAVPALASNGLLVLNNLGRTLSVIDLQTGAIHNNSVQLGQSPNDIAVQGDYAYVVNSLTHDLTVVDLRTMSSVRTIPLPRGSNPYEIEFVGYHTAFVTSILQDQVLVVDVSTDQVTGVIPVGVWPQGLLVQGNLVYVANSGLDKLTYQYGQGTVSIIDATTRQVIQTVAVPRNPQKLEAAPDGTVHVVCTGDYGYQTPSLRGNIAVIGVEYDPVTFAPQYVVTDTIPIGHDPSGIAFTHDSLAFVLGGGFDVNIGGYLDVYNSYSHSILHNGSDSLVIGAGPTTIVTDEEDGRVFVSSFYNDEIQELNPGAGAVIARYPVGDGPGGMALYTRPEATNPWADRVLSFTPGAHSGTLFGESFFPGNVTGSADRNPYITDVNQSVDPAELLSLGTGGEIILHFTNNVIVNGPGPDFTVFENAFMNMWTSPPAPFAETAIVSVSQDGIHFVTFPWDSITLAGLAGKTPTRLGSLSIPDSSGGDAFDLADVGLEWAMFVKLTDTGLLFTEGVFNGDFDLDAVGAIHSAIEPPVNVDLVTVVESHAVEDTPARVTLVVNPSRTADTLAAARIMLGNRSWFIYVNAVAPGQDLSAPQLTLRPEGKNLSETVLATTPTRAALAGPGGTQAIDPAAVAEYFELETNLQQGNGLRITVRIHYDPATMAFPESHLQAVRLDESQGRWTRFMTTIDTVAHTAVFETHRFSLFALGDSSDAVLAQAPTYVGGVELSAFHASPAESGGIHLTWMTASESNNFGFFVERSVDAADWSEIGFIEGQGAVDMPHDYTFSDPAAGLLGTLYYRLRQSDGAGSIAHSAVVSAEALPTAFSLSQNYPNPFNPETRIRFTLPEEARVRLQIYDMLGRMVRTLLNDLRPAGGYTMEWDGANDAGIPAASGIYFCRLEAGDFVTTRKMTLLR